VLTGQTSEAQLQDNFSALDIEFTPTLLGKIAEIHRATPNPAP
jgi:aryl-alcohol dehydrogenase-like predicted oxidoreductase